jgi:hypothetical protein
VELGTRSTKRSGPEQDSLCGSFGPAARNTAAETLEAPGAILSRILSAG